MVVVSLSYFFPLFTSGHAPADAWTLLNLPSKTICQYQISWHDRFVFFTSEKPSKMSVSGKISDHVHQPNK
jgi:hypothetical protein